MKRLLTKLHRAWTWYIECHNTPIVITHAGVLGPIHPDWTNPTTKEQ